MTQQLTLERAFQLAEEGQRLAAAAAGDDFLTRARRFTLEYLRKHGPTSSEDITDACKAAGIKPESGEDRAFGPVYQALSRRKQIVRVAYVPRRKGNAVHGASVWKLADE